MALDLEFICELSLKEKKSILERLAKLMEESGELSQELLIKNKASGFQNKKSTEDGILGEAVDVMLVALSIFFKIGGSIDELSKLMEKKCAKWQQAQN